MQLIKITLFTILLGFSAETMNQEKTKQLVEDGLKRLTDNQQAQKSVDQTFEKIQGIEKDYHDELQLLDGLNMYNAMLKRQLDDQQLQINKFNTSINNATLIERQIMPLLVRMVDALESFVAIDMPFLLQERTLRVADLRELLDKAEFTTSEKFRRVFEAYEIVAFLDALTDPCVLNRNCMSPWIIDGDDVAQFPDTNPLVAIDDEGSEL